MRDGYTTESAGQRGASPVIGIILLVAMVLIGGMLVFMTGSVMMDALQSQAEEEAALTAADETRHQFASIVDGGGPREVPMDDFSVTDDGVLRVGWGDAPTNESNWKWDSIDSTCRANVSPLGSIETEVDGGTVAYQSGAVWMQSDSTTRVNSPPQIGYDGNSLSLQVLQTDAEDLSGKKVARLDESPGAHQTATQIQNAADCSETDLLLVVEETAYHEGWANHLETAFENATVIHDPKDERVTVVVKGIKDVSPYFDIVDYDADTIVANNEPFEVEATIENTGTKASNGEVSLNINPSTTATISELEPGNQTNKTLSIKGKDLRTMFNTGPGVGNGDKHELSRYGEYDYTLATNDTTVESSFFYSYPGKAYYNLTDVSDRTSGNTTTIAAEMTNIGEVEGDYEIKISLESAEEDIDREWSENVSLDPWTDATVEADFNRSELPNGNYAYTVEVVDNPTKGPKTPEYEHTYVRHGTFQNAAGIDCDTGACTVSDGADVTVSVIGTEISAEGRAGRGGEMYKRWGAVTASAVIGDTRYRFLPDGTTEEIPLDDPHYTDGSSEMEDYNLNTFGTQDEVYSVSETIEEGTVTFESTYWKCDQYEEVGTDTYGGKTYTHYDCTDFGDPVTVSVEDGEGMDSSNGFVMTRDADRNELPDIEEGYERQRNINEVFQDGTDGEIEVVERDGGSELTLEELDFAFMTEVTMDRSDLRANYEPRRSCWFGSCFTTGYDGQYSHAFGTEDQTLWNKAAWDIAQDYRHESRGSTGDPNFNDVIGFAQISGGTVDSIDYDALDDFRVDGTKRTPDETRSEGETSVEERGVNIQVDSNRIVIG